MNKLFKYVASILINVSDSVPNKKLLEDILIYLCDVEYVVVSSSDISKIHFTRLNCAYEPLVNLCRLILENMSVQFTSSKLETFVFMFDMNRLFEEFIFEFIKKNRSRIFIDGFDQIIYVKDQFYIGKLFKEFKMKVDILIQCNSGKLFLLDTKYKLLNDEAIHGDLSQSDFYQMFAYSNSQSKRYKNIILLYPKNEKSSGIFRRVCLTHDLGEGEEIKIHIRRIDISKIFNCEKNRFDDRGIVVELNEIFRIEKGVHND